MKHIILFLSFVFVTTALTAQVEIKPTIGINFSNVTGDPTDGTASGQLGWQVGGSIEYGNKVYGELGVLYVQESSEITTSTETIDLNQKGFRIPLAIGWNVLGDMESDVNVHILGGGSANIITGSDGIDKDDLETTQWGVFAGAGVDFWWFFVDLKYEWSLTDISSVTQFDIGKSHSFFVNAGIRIRL
jgi:hypothetical protein